MDGTFSRDEQAESAARGLMVAHALSAYILLTTKDTHWTDVQVAEAAHTMADLMMARRKENDRALDTLAASALESYIAINAEHWTDAQVADAAWHVARLAMSHRRRAAVAG